jgi:hypothetical protein
MRQCNRCEAIHTAQIWGKTSEPCKCDCHLGVSIGADTND